MKILSTHATGTWVLISSMLLLIISVNTYISRSTVTDLKDLQEDITHTVKIVRVLEETHVSLLKAESGQRGFLLTQDENYLTHYKNAVKTIESLLVESEKLSPKINEQVNAISKLRVLITAKLLELDFTVKQAQNEQFTQAIRRVETDQGRMLYDEIHTLFEQIKSAENKIADEQVRTLQVATQVSGRNLAISFFTSILLVLGLFFLAKLNIRNQQMRELEMASQNEKLSLAVEERTKELSLFSDELSRSNRELEDFAFVASHDLQEPLRKIMAFGDRLETQSDNLSEKQRDFLQRMRSAANRMSVLISDLLEFSRVTTRGKDFQEVDLNLIVANCVEDLNVLIEETKVSLDIAPLPTITADPTQMQQLLFNLLANAIKFSKKEVNPIVHISVQNVSQPDSVEVEGLDDWQCISITDNGIGFEQEYAEKIFAPFQRLHSRDSFKGTGIGLAICRRIVERHNGIIKAEGKVDEGATFTVSLPAQNYLISIKQ
ncbi:sensor histidine kinase [Glaciecola sp. 2405UD65-10]|uniref:sensor histidine kinase n=1 Tax=Glaciecola sp. 2405UD65-10 TaxID=3397244 RepID=UPI003B59E040